VKKQKISVNKAKNWGKKNYVLGKVLCNLVIKGRPHLLLIITGDANQLTEVQ